MSEWKEILDFILTIFSIIGSLYAFYIILIKPKIIKTKLVNLMFLVDDWFDEFDCNLEKDLNTALLNNKENKIRDYINNNLSNYQIKPRKKIIRKWNKKMGIKKDLLDSIDLFQKVSRIPVAGIYMDMYFSMLVGNFNKFYTEYSSDNHHDPNFAEIEMPVKFFKFYVRNL